MKRTIFFWTVLIFFFSASIFAQDRIIDNAGLLSSSQIAELSRMADSIAAAYDFDLVIVTESSIGGTRLMDYADDFFDYNGYGLGYDRDGCLLLQVTEDRDYWFSSSGRGINVLDKNEYAFDKLEADVLKYLGENNYYEAYRAFLLDMELFLSLEAKGQSYNFFHKWNGLLLLIFWIIALIIGFAIVGIWNKGMNTALPQTQAVAYIVSGSLAFREKKDNFLYSTVTKTKRETQSSSGGGGGGVHTSSSGSSHGGRGGKY